ncbi:DNA methyltransferase [Paracoccus sp. PARArs4]|uniref:class I SAM-dependent DNA methyltransferase n=1 Tax=Paracoccus sp. PARArs4 TaxID=2853442 RepID=UPI0024A78C93|nr:DNA methyltransferase [Paracoccus sp. PARArs4]
MRLSFNEIRARAARFAKDYADATYEKGETQTFYNDFFQIFGVQRRSVARYEEHVKKLNNKSGFIDLFWPRVLLVEQKSAGRDLLKAEVQAGEYFDAIKETDRPRFQLLCDFQTFQLLDRDTRETSSFALADLPKHVEKFGFIMGMEKRSFKDQDPVNIKAAELVGRLHDSLEASGYKGHQLEVFLTRIVFCLFADDTGIFEPRDIFLDFLENRTKEDGSDIGPLLAQLFDVLDTPEDQRQTTLDEDLARFPYVNGGLFSATIRTPAFNAEMRQRLLDAGQFNWSGISPAIFGSLFQSVMDKQERREAGAHYTTEKNILKVIGPLFLDEFRAEFEGLKARKTNRVKLLQAFHDRLAKLTFLDPACGCGNFLIITYRELRLLEIEVLREIHRDDLARMKGGATELPLQSLLKIDVDQFHGIEFSEFPARIAETAMWMMDHIMNTQASLEFGAAFLRIPLRKSPAITHGDALELDWQALLPAERCSYIIGNPPFIGAKYQSEFQRAQVRRIAGLGKSGGTLDYVAAWFLKAARYGQGHKVPFAFVSTNSIVQGEQVAQLWPALLDRSGMEIAFAHQTFAWGSEARGKAAVHVIVTGLEPRNAARPVKRLFSYPDIRGEPIETQPTAISPYLTDASALANPHVVIREESRPINGLPKLITGSKPIDGGHYIYSSEERDAFIANEPASATYFHPFIGAREFIQGSTRFILRVSEIPVSSLRNMPLVRDVIARVREYRLGNIPSKGKGPETIKPPGMSSLALAENPTAFHVTVVPQAPFLVIPQVSSERRDYAPIGWLNPPTIPSDKLRLMENASPELFALLTSSMHMAWMRAITGRMKSDYMYSVGVVYNTFPLPPANALSALAPHAKAILDARANHPGATLADLYDPDMMPADLRRAHNANDRAVDRLYRRTAFASESDRVAHLLGMYEQQVAGMLATQKQKKPRRTAKSKADKI